MVEADINLRLIPISISDKNYIFKLMVCCLTGMWEHPYAIIQAKLAPDFGFWGHLWSAAATAMATVLEEEVPMSSKSSLP
jgi:hypothetical protein